MKKIMKSLRTATGILLAALLLCGVMSAGLTAAAAPAATTAKASGLTSLLLKPLTDFLASYDLANLTGAQTEILMGILRTLKTLGIDYTAILQAAETYLSAAAKEALRLAGLMDFPAREQGKTPESSALKPLKDFIAGYDLEHLTQAQLDILIKILETLKKLGIDYKPLLEAVDGYLPFAVKAALHDAGLMSYPIWERDFTMYLVFKYLLFGWIWMEDKQTAELVAGLVGMFM